MRFLYSVKTTVVLLILIAVFLVIGTLIPQGLSPEQYAKLYSPATIRVLRNLGFFDVYQSWWFLSLLSLLALNIILCSLKRLSSLSLHPRRLGVYTCHLSLLLIIGGGLITGLYGFKGYMEIEEGKGSSLVFSRGGVFPLPFEVFCEEFRITYWPNGTPKEFVSFLVFKEGERKQRTEVRVNHPVKYKGLTFYQASYGNRGEAELEVALSGRRERISLEPGRIIDLGQVRLGLMRLSLGGQGRAFVVLFLQEPKGFWLKEGQEVTVDGIQVHFIRAILREWTGLQVSYDPGAPVVFLGASFFVIGLFLTFYSRAKDKNGKDS